MFLYLIGHNIIYQSLTLIDELRLVNCTILFCDGLMPGPGHEMTRREEYAQATRQAILDEARRLFSERGYFSTTVDEIATAARVAPATVYAASGGKHGLLGSLIEIWARAPIIAATIGTIEEMKDPVAILRLVAKTCRSMREEFGDIIRLLLATAPHDRGASETLNAATAKYRQAFVPIAQRLLDLHALHDGIDVNEAVDVFWFYFGYAGIFTLHDDNGWSYKRAEQWLCDQASRALLRQPGS
jgi:AcrR family transcriptional regulator